MHDSLGLEPLVRGIPPIRWSTTSHPWPGNPGRPSRRPDAVLGEKEYDTYDLTVGTLVVLPEGGPHAGAGVVNRMSAIGVTVSHAVEQPEPRQATAEEASLLGIQKAALVTHIRRTYYSDQGRPVETADIVVPAAHCEIVYEIPINR